MNLIELMRLVSLNDSENTLEWQREALCNQTDPEAFFPEYERDGRMAKEVCKECPVKQKCFDYAVSNKETFGIWGGVDFTVRRTERERLNDYRKQSEGASSITFRSSEYQRLPEESRSI
jgi:WhiB family redox-sensing transcriptional regulator